MEKKSVIKKITGSREALLAIIVVVLFAVVTVISRHSLRRSHSWRC